MKNTSIKFFAGIAIMAFFAGSIACSSTHHKNKCKDCPEWTYQKTAKAIHDRL